MPVAPAFPPARIGTIKPHWRGPTSTVQVARSIGVNKTTLLRWLYASRLSEPKHVTYAGQDLRMWTEDDLKRSKRHKEQNYLPTGGGSLSVINPLA
jgi:hypothetical protein